MPAVQAEPDSGPGSEPDALISRLRVIENQPLDTRAEAFTQIYESLQAILGGAGGTDAG